MLLFSGKYVFFLHLETMMVILFLNFCTFSLIHLQANRILDLMETIPNKIPGLYPLSMYTAELKFERNIYSIGERGDSFYEYR